MQIRRLFTPALFMVFGISGLFVWHFASAQGRETEPLNPNQTGHSRTVRVVEVTQQETTSVLRFPAVIEAADNARLTSMVSGFISFPDIRLGQVVRSGEVMATIYNPQLAPAESAAMARLKEAKVRLAQSERDHQRVNRLAKKGAVSESELEQAHAIYDAAVAAQEAAEAQLIEAKKLLSEAVVRAPFDGTVDRTYFENGEYIQPGQSLFELSGLSALELEIDVPEKLVSGLALNDQVEVVFPYLNRLQLTGRIIEKSQSSRVGQLYQLIVSVPSHNQVLPGMTAEVHLSLPGKPALMAPIQAIVDPAGQGAKVFVLNPTSSTVNAISVKVERIRGAFVSVAGNLQSGDRIVIAGQHNLVDGQAVRVLDSRVDQPMASMHEVP